MITNIGELFEINYGQSQYEKKENLKQGKTILVASGGINNGIHGFFDIPKFYNAPIISVPRTGTIGQAFVQPYDCCISSDSLVLIPKTKMKLEELYQVAFQIRLNKWKFCYGRKITPYRLKKQKIKIENIRTNVKDLVRAFLPKEKERKEIQKLNNVRILMVKDLCEINRKTATPQGEINLDGKTPYVSSTSKNNGVVLFTDEEPNSKAGSLTVAKDGNDGFSFYQPFDFITNLHNYVLTMKNNLPKFLLLYIGAIVKMKSSRYNHYYPLSKKHLERMEIPLPYKNKEIDLEQIKKIVKNAYGFNKLSKYL